MILSICLSILVSLSVARFLYVKLSGIRHPGVGPDAERVRAAHDVCVQPRAGGGGGPQQEAPARLVPGEVPPPPVFEPSYWGAPIEMENRP